MVKGEYIFIVYAIPMTIVKSLLDNNNNSLGRNNSEEWSINSLIDNNRLSVILTNNYPNYCTNCQGGGCGICTPRF